ncbi:MAG: glycosyltransferase family 2 protein [Rhodospirillaceae bacterium]|nr:glycosyltransferase family 2 protein [Rhodospirillaceae bacterium]
MAKACVVVPTKDEEASIAGVIAEIRRGFVGTRYNRVAIIVVDDSTDGTRRIARACGATVLPGDGDGLGSAMLKGLHAAATLEPDVILSIDGDGQADPASEIPRFLRPIEADEADLVVGSRFAAPNLVGYRYHWLRRLGTRVLCAMIRAQTGLRLTDSHGGLRAMRPEVAASLELLGTHTYVQETIIDAVAKGFRVVEVPSVWRPRQAGTSRVVASIPRYVFYTLPVLLLRWGQHIRWLYTLGLLAILAALALFGEVFISEGLTFRLAHRTPALLLVALLVITGVELFFFGFVLQLLKQIKKGVDRRPARLEAEPAVWLDVEPAWRPAAVAQYVDERKRTA